MKKLSLSFLGALLLTVFSSCSFFQPSSSISFSFPENTSTQLSAFRELVADTVDEKPFYVKFSSTGDWENTVSKSYSKLEEVNNSKFEFENLKPDAKLTIALELGYKNKTYYKAQKDITLATGDNYVTMKLELVDIQIPDFSIKANYLSDETAVYDGKTPIPLTNDTLVFNSDSDYQGKIEWKINNQPFNGKINPLTTELTLNKIGLNVVECTITDQVFAKINKSKEFSFEFLTEQVNVALSKAVPKFTIAIQEPKEFYYLENTDLKFTLTSEAPFKSGTHFTWKLNNVLLEEDTDNHTLNLSTSDDIVFGKNYLTVSAEFDGYSESNVIEFIIKQK